MQSDRPLSQRIFAYAILEGVLLQGPFLCLNHFRHRGMLNGVVYGNDKIMSDENLHKKHLVYLLKTIFKITQHEAYEVTFISST